MRRTAILASLAAALLFSAYTGTSKGNTEHRETTVAAGVAVPAKGKAYNVVLDKSELKWNAKKITGAHNGTINLKSGQLEVNKNRVTGGEFVIDMGSLVCSDNAKVGAHLKNDDFFGVEKFPTATFKVSSVKPIENAVAGEPNFTVTGDLTIKNITNPVSFPAIINVKSGVATATGDVTVDRTKYDIRYRSSSFFSDLGDKAIYDDFTVSLNITAQQASI
ncbi:YceI family protein [Pontibacter silvestris]|uniref:YceI family protein n=1 Tax=Pontibacter silvestris TaxID=2305183 RepID=A0ABW4WU33_9BACT|nr:YceI family protein [Pontibacter silvestris]MCC9139030.1 YceI family protein [Pontibacter silvestris]